MARPLRLDRSQLSRISKDAETVRVLEAVVEAVNDLLQQGGFCPAGTLTTLQEFAADRGSPQGLRSHCIDSTVVAVGNYGAVIAGGGVETVPAFFNGTDWVIG